MNCRKRMFYLWPCVFLFGLIIAWRGQPKILEHTSQTRLSGTSEAVEANSPSTLPVNRSLIGRCLAPDGSLVSSATIVGFGLSNEGTWEWRGEADANGEFQLNPPDNHDCELVIYSEVYAPTRVLVSARQTELGSLPLAAGQRLHGVVRGVDKSPVAGAVIALRSQDRGSNRSLDFGRDLAIKSGPDGRFLTPMMSGKYTLFTPKKFDTPFHQSMRLVSSSTSFAVLPVELEIAAMPSELTVQVVESCSLQGTVTNLAGSPAAKTPVVLNLLIGNRGCEFDETLTDDEGHYLFNHVPAGAGVSLQILGQQSSNEAYTCFVPVQPVHDALAQPGALILKRVTVNRSDLHWRAERHQLNDVPTSLAGADKPTNSPSRTQLITQIQDLKHAWGRMSQKASTPMPDESLFRALLQTGREETQPDESLTALRFLMEIGGKGTDPMVLKYREMAMEALIERFIDHPDIDIVLTRGAVGGIPSKTIARHLQTVAEKSPHRQVQAMAHLGLAQLNLEVGRLIPALSGVAEDANSSERFEGERKLKHELKRAIGQFQWSIEEANDAATQELNWLLEHAHDVPVPSLFGSEDDQGAFLHRSPPSSSDRTFAYVASHLLTTSPQFAVGKVPQELNGETLDGQAFSLDSLRGQVVVVVFSAQWCAPCRAERPSLRKFIQEFADQPVRLIGISGDHEREEAMAARESGEITWPTLWDGGNDGKFVETWNVRSWPTIVVLNQQGKIAARDITAAALPNLVQSLLDRPSN
jgi:thiol-disulfide isomerase/thioredoxin